MSRHCSRSAGFSLIEMLVALTLIGMMTAGLFGGLRFGTRVWESSETATVETRDRAASANLLRRLISTAIPRFVLSDGVSAAGLEGTTGRLRLLAPWPNAHGVQGLQMFELKKSTDGRGLVLEWWLAREVRPDASTIGSHLVFPGATGIRIRYFGVSESDSKASLPARWRDDWPASSLLPRLVELRPTGPRYEDWPVLRVAPAGAGQ